MLLYISTILLLVLVVSFDVVGWYSVANLQDFPLDQFHWDAYTHITLAGLLNISPDGRVSCPVVTDMTTNQKIQKYASARGKRILTLGTCMGQLLTNTSFRTTYLSTIGEAATTCNIDGLEWDYEWVDTIKGRSGIVSRHNATVFTYILDQVQQALGNPKTVSADMGVWGLTRGSYPLMFEPWVNVSILAKNPYLYLNSMSYHHPQECNSIDPWEKDLFVLHELWGIPKTQLNLGLGYFSFNGTYEPLWRELSDRCPNVRPEMCQCEGTYFVSKVQNARLGELVQSQGYRGLFPWMATYDSFRHNNSMVDWIHRH